MLGVWRIIVEGVMPGSSSGVARKSLISVVRLNCLPLNDFGCIATVLHNTWSKITHASSGSDDEFV